MNSSLGILWQACPGGVRILRVFGDSPCPALPVQIEGFPVVEIGPYCFAQNQRSQPADARFWSVDGRGPATYPHPIAGDFVQGVTLPAGVRALHNAAFYNCRELTRLSIGTGIEGIGSDLFTNCWELRELNPALPRKALFRSGMNIGKDAMGTMANTLILAFSGSSLNLLLLCQIFDYPLIQIFNTDAIAIELIRGLAGSIGIILTVPLVALLASQMMGPQRAAKK